jgi:hypothetical protein
MSIVFYIHVHYFDLIVYYSLYDQPMRYGRCCFGWMLQELWRELHSIKDSTHMGAKGLRHCVFERPYDVLAIKSLLYIRRLDSIVVILALKDVKRGAKH